MLADEVSDQADGPVVIIELGSLRAIVGYAGEPAPRCVHYWSGDMELYAATEKFGTLRKCGKTIFCA